MRGADLIAEGLKAEGISFVVGFPENLVFDAAADRGIRPLIARTERVAVNIADGFSRASQGRAFGVVACQEGPGAEAAFAAVAQAYGDNSPILVIPASYDHDVQGIPPYLDVQRTYGPITKLTTVVNEPGAIKSAFRRSLNALHCGPRGPVVLSPSHDLLYREIGEARLDYARISPARSMADPGDVKEIAEALLASRNPVIVAGQGVLYAEASAELQKLAEMIDGPVMSTLNGKSAFPENHRLALGTGGRTRPKMVDHFLAKADFILGVGTSLTVSDYITALPEKVPIAQITHNPDDIGKCYDVGYAAIGDVKLVLRQLIEAVKSAPRYKEQSGIGDRAKEIRAVKEAFLAEWMPLLTSNEKPTSPYRVVWELANNIDRQASVVTHDAGNPRDQITPFFEAVVPGGYLGWGKTTQLGSGLGLAMGAKLARPDWAAINVMGDAAFGMVAADVETAVRLSIPITTVVLNNGVMGGYGKFMPIATRNFAANRVSGRYSELAKALGAYSEAVEEPGELGEAIRRCIAQNKAGQAALLEVFTREESKFSL